MGHLSNGIWMKTQVIAYIYTTRQLRHNKKDNPLMKITHI